VAGCSWFQMCHPTWSNHLHVGIVRLVAEGTTVEGATGLVSSIMEIGVVGQLSLVKTSGLILLCMQM